MLLWEVLYVIVGGAVCYCGRCCMLLWEVLYVIVGGAVCYYGRCCMLLWEVLYVIVRGDTIIEITCSKEHIILCDIRGNVHRTVASKLSSSIPICGLPHVTTLGKLLTCLCISIKNNINWLHCIIKYSKIGVYFSCDDKII